MTTLQLTVPSRVSGVPGQVRRRRIDVAFADLAAGEDIGAIDRAALRVLMRYMYGRLINVPNVAAAMPSHMPSGSARERDTGCAGSIPVPSSAM